MESGDIADDQISASSSFDDQSVGPQNGRIRTEIKSGAWCPQKMTNPTTNEFLQVSFPKIMVIRGIETQGRYGNGTGREFLSAYRIEYFRFGGRWVRYHNRHGGTLLPANNDTQTAVLNKLDPPIVASKIRIVTYAEQPTMTCLRAEFYGCEDTEHLLAYSVNRDGNWKDRTFEDTEVTDNIMGGKLGLGLLTDGFIATHSPFGPHLDPVNNSTWLGWSKNVTNGQVVVLFEFEKVRNFTDVEFHTWGNPDDEIQVIVQFSRDGNVFLPHNDEEKKFPNRALTSMADRKRRSETAKDEAFSFRLPFQKEPQGKFVRIKMNFKGSWLFLTEIHFNTALFGNGTAIDGTEVVEGSVYGLYYVIIGVLILLFLIFAIILCALFVLKQRGFHAKKLGGQKKSSNGTYKSGLLVTTLGGNGTPRHIVHPPMSDRNPDNKLIAQFTHGPLSERGSLQRILSSSRSCSSGTMSRDHPPSLLDINFPPPPPSAGSSETSASDGIYADASPTAPLIATPTRRRRNPSSVRTRTLPNRPSIVAEEVSADPMDVPTSESSNTSSLDTSLAPVVVRIPRESITLREQIGEGKFTAIFTADITGINVPAVIKAIKDGAGDLDAATKALVCEAHILASLDHPNIVRLYGVCDDCSVVIEHVPFGSVREFIHNVQPEKLNFASMLHFVANIASGMKYLEQKRIVHGHLSPRNCLVEQNLNVKIAAPRGPMHHAQLRYSAPESIILNEWTNKSDAWSFGTTAWEILHFCRHIPFENCANQELVDHARAVVDGKDPYIKLPFSDDCCPPEIRDQLLECCLATPETRPAFLELQLFLSRKAMTFTLQHKRQRPSANGGNGILPQSVSLYR
uniref:F5/8 type C domain-containing protein n=1 Tax=Panagrellus redivivus TaxID=6233 RepID=A0A7E4VYS6_PANRE